jgi:hypothetical protein
MAGVIDVKNLNKDEIRHLIIELLNQNLITMDILTELVENKNKDTSEGDMSHIESLINKHFEEYDEVFRKLA